MSQPKRRGVSDNHKEWLMVANWKMNLPQSSLDIFAMIKDYVEKTLDHISYSHHQARGRHDATHDHDSKSLAAREVKVVICPPYPFLAAMNAALCAVGEEKRLYLGAQNLHSQSYGSFTGEVSAGMLADVGVRYVIVGHAERRRQFGESPSDIQAKLAQALAVNMRPILCLGESADQRKGHSLGAFLGSLLRQCLDAIEPTHRLLIAYEPLWAIHSSQPATVEQIEEVLGCLRDALVSHWGLSFGKKVSFLYGGSVDARYAEMLRHMDGLSGALVGRASLSVNTWGQLLAAVMI